VPDATGFVIGDRYGNTLSAVGVDGETPDWSPDGDRIAYVARGRIKVARIDGSGGAGFRYTGLMPRWSPDGRRIAYRDNGPLKIMEFIDTRVSRDCNGNGVPDECELTETLDCNQNGRLDMCDIALGTSLDCNDSGIPDECEISLFGDYSGDGLVNFADWRAFEEDFAGSVPVPVREPVAPCFESALAVFDSDEDSDIDLIDYATIQLNIGRR
jgi:hypothetical protein